MNLAQYSLFDFPSLFTILSLLIMYVFSKIWLEITPTGSSCLFQFFYTVHPITHIHTQRTCSFPVMLWIISTFTFWKLLPKKEKLCLYSKFPPITSVLFVGCYGLVPAIQSRSMSQISSCTFGRQRGTRWYLFCRWTWRCQVVYRGRCRRKKPPLWSGRCHRNPHPRWTSGWWECGVSFGW